MQPRTSVQEQDARQSVLGDPFLPGLWHLTDIQRALIMSAIGGKADIADQGRYVAYDRVTKLPGSFWIDEMLF